MSDGAIMLDGRGLAEVAAQLQVLVKRTPSRRAVAGIVGIPGSGKSTLATSLAGLLNRAAPGFAVVVPMDGFHLSTEVLRWEGLAEEKGAPSTFDGRGYAELLRRARASDWTGPVPVYDRTLHEPVFSGRTEDRVTTSARLLLAEGNYLRLDWLPWSQLHELLDTSYWLNVPWSLSETRLRRRHERVGHTRDVVEQKLANDRRNAVLIEASSRHCDRVLCWPSGDGSG